ncbi:MarR family transcriptional regulator [Nocardia acidivorans]|uniref:MarR family transcriptional regulator n=1 Tax=Nocardia acidivorans TaxID=404580 RepID=UPI0012F8206B|nr:helix-turn-helix domain-containing protein [Nocardia acidivorans]
MRQRVSHAAGGEVRVTPGVMAAEYAVPGVLAAGDPLTIDEVRRRTGLTGRAVRAAVARLERRGLIGGVARPGQRQITPRGRMAWVTKGPRRSW